MARSGPVTKDVSTVALGLAQIRVGNAATNIANNAPCLLSQHSIGALASTKYVGNVDYWKLESGFPLLEDFTIPMRESSMLECEFKEISSYNLALARGIDPGSSGIAASISVIGSNTADGTTGATPISVGQTDGPVTDTFLVTFTSGSAYDVVGVNTGFIGSGTVSASYSPANGGNPYFTIPANYFTGTWLANETHTFATQALVVAGGAYTDPHAGAINLGALAAPAFVRMEAVYTYPNGINTMTIIFPRANATSSIEIDMQAEDNANVPLTFEAKRADSETAGGNAVWDVSPLGRIVFA